MKKNLFRLATLSMALIVSFSACTDDDNEQKPPVIKEKTIGAYILNTGGWGKNNASIGYYNLNDANYTFTDLFKAENGYGLGDLGQDICLYGSKLYVTCSGSSKVEIMDKDAKVLKTLNLIDDNGKAVSPRYMTAANGYVFFTAYDGNINRIDTLTMSITGKVAVGDHPEGITNANGKLYANISGYGTGKTVAVVDISTFKKTKDLNVKLNPNTQMLTADDGCVYFVSNGNYAKPSMPEADRVYQTMQRIDPATDVVTEICRATYIANYNKKMYILYSEYYYPELKSASIYDLNTKQSVKFIEPSAISNGTLFINADTENGNLYIGEQSGETPGKINVYKSDGTFTKSLTVGYYPGKVCFNTTKVIVEQ